MRRTNVHPAGAVKVAEFDFEAIDAIMTSLSAVPVGLEIVSVVWGRMANCAPWLWALLEWVNTNAGFTPLVVRAP